MTMPDQRQASWPSPTRTELSRAKQDEGDVGRNARVAGYRRGRTCAQARVSDGRSGVRPVRVGGLRSGIELEADCRGMPHRTDGLALTRGRLAYEIAFFEGESSAWRYPKKTKEVGSRVAGPPLRPKHGPLTI